MSQIRCTVTTPEKTEIDVSVDSVTVPLYDGEMGILPGHAPLIGRLGFGLMKFKNAGQITSKYVDGGFVQVSDDNVSILTDRLQDPAKLDLESISEELRVAFALPSDRPELAAIKSRAVERARKRKSIASH